MNESRKKLAVTIIIICACVLSGVLGYIAADNSQSYKEMQEIKTAADEDFIENLEIIVSAGTSDEKALYEALVINTNLLSYHNHYLNTPKRDMTYEEIGSAENAFQYATEIAQAMAKDWEYSSEDEEWILSFIAVLEKSLSDPEPIKYLGRHFAAEGGWYQ